MPSTTRPIHDELQLSPYRTDSEAVTLNLQDDQPIMPDHGSMHYLRLFRDFVYHNRIRLLGALLAAGSTATALTNIANVEGFEVPPHILHITRNLPEPLLKAAMLCIVWPDMGQLFRNNLTVGLPASIAVAGMTAGLGMASASAAGKPISAMSTAAVFASGVAAFPLTTLKKLHQKPPFHFFTKLCLVLGCGLSVASIGTAAGEDIESQRRHIDQAETLNYHASWLLPMAFSVIVFAIGTHIVHQFKLTEPTSYFKLGFFLLSDALLLYSTTRSIDEASNLEVTAYLGAAMIGIALMEYLRHLPQTAAFIYQPSAATHLVAYPSHDSISPERLASLFDAHSGYQRLTSRPASTSSADT